MSTRRAWPGVSRWYGNVVAVNDITHDARRRA